jgi:hypothetical protein
MTEYVPTIIVDNVIDALAAFISPFMLGGEVIRGQTNRVSMPQAPFVLLTEIGLADLGKPHSRQSDASDATIYGHKRIDIQVDFYGATGGDAGDFCGAIKSAFRSEWGSSQFPTTIQPLYCDDGRQIPLITGEEQYESRWTLTASLQYNPTVTVPQQSADALAVAKTESIDLF